VCGGSRESDPQLAEVLPQRGNCPALPFTGSLKWTFLSLLAIVSKLALLVLLVSVNVILEASVPAPSLFFGGFKDANNI
jgi:hypothetical protein